MGAIAIGGSSNTCWSTLGGQNGTYTISMVVTQITWYMSPGGSSSNTSVDSASTIGVNVQNLLIQNATPASGSVFVYNPTSTTGGSPPAYTKSFDVSISGASKSVEPVTLTIYDMNQNAVRTMAAGAATNGVVVGGDASGSTNVHLDWDGTLGNAYGSGSSSYPQQGPPALATPGIYCFQWRVGNLCASSSNGYVGYNGPPANYGYYGNDGDTDISTSLTVSVPNTSASEVDDDLHTAKVATQYVVNSSTWRSASSGKIVPYDLDFTTMQSTDLTPGDLTAGSHKKTVSIPTPDEDGSREFAITGQDDDSGTYRGRHNRCFLPNFLILKSFSGAVSGTFSEETARSLSLAGVISVSTTCINTGDEPVFSFLGVPELLHQGKFVWDSTHFPDHTLVLFKQTAINSVGEEAVEIFRRRVYNKAYSLSNQDLDTSQAAAAGAIFNSINIKTNASTADGTSAILNNLKNYTVFYMNTHSSPTTFLDCSGVGRAPDTNRLYALVDPGAAAPDVYSVSHAVVDRKQAGGVSLPPYNFVFLDGCSSSVGNDHATAFGISSTSNHRAFMGWPADMQKGRAITKWVRSFLVYLQKGMDVDEAIEKVGTDLDDPPGSLPGGPIGPVKPTVIGDGTMTIHGLKGRNIQLWHYQP